MSAAVKPPPAAKRKRGKKSDPKYSPVTLRLDRELYYDVKRRVIGTEWDVSEIVNRLLRTWLDDVPWQTRSRKRT